MTQPLAEWLKATGAHHDLVTWAEPFGDDWKQAVTACPRGDWLLAIAVKLGAPTTGVALAAAQCARSCLDVVPDDFPLPARGLDALERWVRGEIAPSEVHALAEALERADPPDPAVAAATMAAHAALAAAAEPEHAPGAPANAAQAAVFAVGDCAMMAALGHSQRTCAGLVRDVIDFDTLLSDRSA